MMGPIPEFQREHGVSGEAELDNEQKVNFKNHGGMDVWVPFLNFKVNTGSWVRGNFPN